MADAAQERFTDLMQRQVGFELFEAPRANPLPAKPYVAIYGRYVLLGFTDQADADKFFATAIESTL